MDCRLPMIAWCEARLSGTLPMMVAVPLLIIDGREITWDKLGRMLMSFEGWQFKLTVGDKSEEL